jgi:hypothetical protein
VHDPLLQPSLQDREPDYGDPPWRLESQVWVAFFGGVEALTIIAWLNCAAACARPRSPGAS